MKADEPGEIDEQPLDPALDKLICALADMQARADHRAALMGPKRLAEEAHGIFMRDDFRRMASGDLSRAIDVLHQIVHLFGHSPVEIAAVVEQIEMMQAQPRRRATLGSVIRRRLEELIAAFG